MRAVSLTLMLAVAVAVIMIGMLVAKDQDVMGVRARVRKIMKTYLWIGAICLVAVAVFVVLFYRANPTSKYSSSNTPIDVLIEENADYARARTLARAGNSMEAEKAYNAALITATDSVQQGQIKFGIAQTKDYQGDFVGSVRLFKELVDDTNNIPLLRAYAVQWMVDINNNGVPEVTKEVFSTSPYSEMVVEGDVALTNRHLAEYGSAIYPLGLLEMYVAIWYAEKITETPPPSEAPAYVTIIKKKIENAERDIERAKNDTGARASIPDILQYEARVKAGLAIAGAGSGADAEAQFQRAFAAMATYGMAPWYDEYTRLNYAIFLMRMYGQDRTADIHATIAPIYENPIYKTAPIVTYLKNIAAGGPIDPNKKKYIGQLANYDAGFKTYLLSLGWKTSDLK